MKVSFERREVMDLDDVEVGECFRLSNTIYMKTNEESESTGYITCVDIEEGCLENWRGDVTVELLETKLVVFASPIGK